jgi:ubiquinone/menaquinone biosynthesis C-methylase UbiE
MDNFIRHLISPPEKKILKFVRPGTVAADLGCGPGYFTIPIAKIVRPTGKVYAVDSHEESIRAVKRKSMAQGLENIIETHASSAATVDFIPTATVDFVFANGLLCCMTDHKGAVAEIKRILKPSGLAYLSVTKMFRRSDGRAVPKDEWTQILADFTVNESREGILNRSAIVSRHDR